MLGVQECEVLGVQECEVHIKLCTWAFKGLSCLLEGGAR